MGQLILHGSTGTNPVTSPLFYAKRLPLGRGGGWLASIQRCAWGIDGAVDLTAAIGAGCGHRLTSLSGCSTVCWSGPSGPAGQVSAIGGGEPPDVVHESAPLATPGPFGRVAAEDVT